MTALTWAGADAVEVTEVPAPVPGPGQQVVEVAYSGICGTDLHIMGGTHPRAKPGLVLGHEVVGYLAGDAAGMSSGTPVFVDPSLSCGACEPCRARLGHICTRLELLGIDVSGGLASRVAVPESSLVVLPRGLEMHRAALIEPTAVAMRALRRGGSPSGGSVHVVGGGPIGLLVGLGARAAGVSSVTFSEPSPHRADAVRDLGFEVVSGSADVDAHVVFDCTGHRSAAAKATEFVAPAGTLVVVGIYPGAVPFDLQDVAFRELTVVGTRTYERPDIEAAIHVLTSDRMDPDSLVTAILPLCDAPDAFDRLRAGHELKVLIDTREDTK